MYIVLKEGIVEGGQREFYLVGLDSYDDFDYVIDILDRQHQLRPIEKIDGIYSRTATFELSDIGIFKIVYHEEVGTYAFSLRQTDDANSFIREILKEVVEEINSLLRQGS